MRSVSLRPYRRRLDRHAACAPHQEKLKVDIFVGPISVRLRPHADQAVAQTALQRTQALPLQAIERIAVGMALYQRDAGELLSPIVVVAVLAGQIELALARAVELAARLDELLGLLVRHHCDRHPPRVFSDKRTEREQIAALMRKRRRLLLLGAAEIDTLFDVDRAVPGGRERRVARRDAAHR